MARTGSKRQNAIDIMTANADKSMADVLPLIAEANGITIAAAKSYYVWIVKNTDTPGAVEVAARQKAVKRMAREVVAKTKKVDTKQAAVEKLAETKSPEEIERIKAANLARIMQVAKKFNKNKEADNVVESDVPAFLTKKEVENLYVEM